MTKLQFLLALHDKLTGLPRDEVEERLNFYSEMIEDRMEDGLSEEEAVAAIGSVSFTMCAFNEGGRFIRIFGTDGELVACSEKKEMELFTFGAKKWADERQKWEVIPHDAMGNDVESGHGGGDTGIMEDVLSLLRGETPSNSVCDVRVSYENHLTGFAAEESRVTNQIINLKEYEANL